MLRKLVALLMVLMMLGSVVTPARVSKEDVSSGNIQTWPVYRIGEYRDS